MLFSSDFYYDQESVNGISKYWRHCLALKLSIGCYVDFGGERNLVALNIFVIDTLGEIKNVEVGFINRFVFFIIFCANDFGIEYGFLIVGCCPIEAM